MTAIIKREIQNLNWRHWLSICGLVILFLALRWNNVTAPLGRDEGEYAYAAQLLIQGVAPYQHAFIQKPPAVIYSYALSDLLLPNFFWSPRILAALFTALATLLLGLIARLEFGKGVALPAMWLATPMVLLPRLELSDANVETFLLLPLMATVATCCYSRQHGNKGWHWLAAGFLAGVTLLYKYTALPVLAFVFIAWLFEMWRHGAKANLIFRLLMCAAAGGILAFALGLAFFLIQDGGRAFWECTMTFNRYYTGTSSFGLNYSWSRIEDFWGNWWVLFGIPWAILLQPGARIWFCFGIFISALLATAESSYGHYYAIIMPFWALLSAVGIRTLAERLGQRMGPLSPWAETLAAMIVVVLVLRPDVPWMLCSSSQFAEEKMGQYPFREAQLLADEVSRRSSPNDFIYVAGSEPEIYYYAHRFSPTRFITVYALMIVTPLAVGCQHEVIRDLQQHPPKLIVFAQTGAGWLRQTNTPPDFQNFLGQFLQNYHLAGGYVKSDPPKGYWTTNLDAAEFKSSSLLLYERKSDE
jgi:hypothetical protein